MLTVIQFGMADIVITPGNLYPSGAAQITRGIAAVAITAGQVVAFNSSSPPGIALSDNDATPPLNLPIGIAVCSAGVGQPVNYTAIDANLTIGATVVNGTIYVLSGNPGGICPTTDLLTGDGVCIIGVGKGTTALWLNVLTTGISI